MSNPTYRAGKAGGAAMGLDSHEEPSWAFVSNLSIEDSGGGFSGMNLAAWSVLSARFDSRYVGPVCPSTDRLAALLSKGSKLARRPRSLFAFSERRLTQFKEQVIKELSTGPPHMVMFHGFTPWIKVDPGVPYVAWSDCTFREYMRTYHDEQTFSSRDLDRIHRQEAQWLRAATRVIFSSQYAARIAQSECGLDTDRVGVVGICGQIELPDRDRYSGSMDFLFVSTNFDKKGGGGSRSRRPTPEA
ncbi:glycosyltransferase family 4 protein [bacterium]|nr:glycosyltransferase family 4 protein [bacterium]